MNRKGKLTFYCGKMGAGKSTRAATLAEEVNGVLISEDHWLASLYPGQINSFDDYLKLSAVIKPLIKTHVQSILNAGAHVVMDFPANTVSQRAWFKALCVETGCEHELIFLDISNQQCLAQIARRRIEQPDRAPFDTEAVFHHVTQYFEAPDDSEALNVSRVCGD